MLTAMSDTWSPSRLSFEVAQSLRSKVHAGEILPGSRFPAERELAEQLSVSRVTLRESLKLLQAEGYIEIRRGPQGGAYVTDLQAPAKEWRRRMTAEDSGIDELFDFRIAVETAAARFAAMRRGSDDVIALQNAISSMCQATNRGEFRFFDSRFHEAVAAAAHSPRLMDTVRQIRGEVFTPMDLLGIPTSPQDDAEKHSGVLEAIRASDPVLAAERMSDHLEHTRAHLKQILRD